MARKNSQNSCKVCRLPHQNKRPPTKRSATLLGKARGSKSRWPGKKKYQTSRGSWSGVYGTTARMLHRVLRRCFSATKSDPPPSPSRSPQKMMSGTKIKNKLVAVSHTSVLLPPAFTTRVCSSWHRKCVEGGIEREAAPWLRHFLPTQSFARSIYTVPDAHLLPPMGAIADPPHPAREPLDTTTTTITPTPTRRKPGGSDTLQHQQMTPQRI